MTRALKVTALWHRLSSLCYFGRLRFIRRGGACPTLVVIALLVATFLGIQAAAAQTPAEESESDTSQVAPNAALDAVATNIENLITQQRFAEARAICQSGFDSSGDYETRALYLRYLARTYEKEGNLDQALALYQQVRTDFPQSTQAPVALYSIASMQAQKAKGPDRQTNLEAAIATLEQFVAEYPQDKHANRALRIMHGCVLREARQPRGGACRLPEGS